MVSFTDVFNSSPPLLSVKLANVERFQQLRTGNEEAYLAFQIDADLEPAFNWNTKQVFLSIAAEYPSKKNALNQVSLWDRIIQHLDEKHIKLPYVRNKYKLQDQGSHLKNKELNLTMYYHIMPFVGRMRSGSVTFPIKMPSEYISSNPLPSWKAMNPSDFKDAQRKK
eukprot:CAMPEP_0196583232 /NCGR_PEP_ID=MMETSP1081-20130531/42600_1 /TAXON_ID=36882 /ORGANISM="Pyramimonas amylifera, Strain CCMP720" /LENGTH=166 /DNA_ID=CAMNT_0041904049 /DNA_START=273 /DNA_END=773 /DNA_ORIENTATION=+